MSTQARILIVDDDPMIRLTVSMILKHEGYLVDAAENGKEAISKSEGNYYNLALVDIRLPDMEGTKLLSLLEETSPKMVKIIMTGFPTVGNAIDAITNRVDSYLTKPMNPEKILETIREELSKQEKEKEFAEENMTKYITSRFKQARAAQDHPITRQAA
jgi:two-component system response regulator PilR (NtrC family)